MPSATGGATFPTDDALLTYGSCAGSAELSNTSVYKDIAAGIEAGAATGVLIAGTIDSAVYGLTFIGASTLATTLSVAAAAAIPVIGWAVGIAVGVYTALKALGLNSCNIPVPSPNGTEQIECEWYPQFVQNALQWVSENAATALTMSVNELSTTHNIFASVDDPLYKIDNTLPDARQYIQSLPTAYDILKQLQLPAAAALIAAAPGLLLEMTGVVAATNQTPIQVQFPALTNNDVGFLFSKFQDAYRTTRQSAQDWALTKSNWPIDLTTFASQHGISAADANAIITSNNIPHTGTLEPIVPITGGNHPGAGYGGGAGGTFQAGGVTSSSSVLMTIVGGAAIAGAGWLLYNKFVKHRSFKSTVASVGHEASGLYGKAKSHLHFKRHRNPLMLKSATGGREVAYRVNLDNSDRVALTKSGALLFRNDEMIAKFKASKYQKTKIRSGSGEVLVFTDQLI